MTLTMNRAQTAGILVLLLSCAGCARQPGTEAELCLLIDFRHDSETALVPDLESFAQVQSLEVDRSLPIPALYTLIKGGRKLASITYSLGKREGTELALFRFDEAGSAGLATALGEFVDRKIRPRYAIYQCSEVPGYDPPRAGP